MRRPPSRTAASPVTPLLCRAFDELELRDKLIELGLLTPSEDGFSEESSGLPLAHSVPGAAGGQNSEEAEDLSPLGAALIEALREAGEDPSELIRRREREE